MTKKYFFVLLFLCSAVCGYSQIKNDSTSTNKSDSDDFVFRPTIGFGTGLFSYIGHIYANENHHFQNPLVGRIAYEMDVSEALNPYFTLDFYTLFGKLGVNENLPQLGLDRNFESQIRLGGLHIEYNFDNFLPKKRKVSPFIGTGFESFEFLSKTDLYDKNGNQYYYWQDGSIRNMAQNNPNAGNSIIIQRDYTYESDIRTMNVNGYGKYTEQSFAIPISVGAIFHLSDRTFLKIGTTLHYTFTNYIDGVAPQGSKLNDMFVMSSFSLHYDLSYLGRRKRNAGDTLDAHHFDDVDFYALDKEDADKDGVPDIKDSCPGTPAGVAVDKHGCPLDSDHDGVPDYLDKEPNTPAGSFVDADGVAISDSTFKKDYLIYMDSTGEFAQVIVRNHEAIGNFPKESTASNKEYTVELGTYKNGIPTSLMTKLLSISDVKVNNMPDSTTVYTAGNYSNYLDAERRKKQLTDEDSINNTKIVSIENGIFVDATAATASMGTNKETQNTNSSATKGNSSNSSAAENNNPDKTSKTSVTNTAENTHPKNNFSEGANSSNSAVGSKTSGAVVFRVQLGAYRKKLSKNVFRGVPDLLEIRTDDGLYKYMTGSFSTFEQAAQHKVDMLVKGYQGAFITAYKDGKRVSLDKVGATPVKNEPIENPQDTSSSAVNTVDKKLVIFKVQLGVFKNDPPAEIAAKFSQIKGLKKEVTSSGLNKYVVGELNDYNAALKLKSDLVSKFGIKDAFVTAFFNGQYITIPEALELMKN